MDVVILHLICPTSDGTSQSSGRTRCANPGVLFLCDAYTIPYKSMMTFISNSYPNFCHSLRNFHLANLKPAVQLLSSEAFMPPDAETEVVARTSITRQEYARTHDVCLAETTCSITVLGGHGSMTALLTSTVQQGCMMRGFREHSPSRCMLMASVQMSRPTCLQD